MWCAGEDYQVKQPPGIPPLMGKPMTPLAQENQVPVLIWPPLGTVKDMVDLGPRKAAAPAIPIPVNDPLAILHESRISCRECCRKPSPTDVHMKQHSNRA